MENLALRSDLVSASAGKTARSRRLMTERVADASIFLLLLVISGLFVLAVTIATPLVVLISAVTGLFAKSDAQTLWQPVTA